MIRPDYLQKGDEVGIIPPANFVSADYIELASRVFRDWGFTVRYSANMYSQHNQFAGSDEERLHALQEFLDDEKLKAVICARGGYGTTRIIDNLSFKKFKQHPKWLAGFSDITALLLKIDSLGIECIHGPMPITFNQEKDTGALSWLYEILTGKQDIIYHFASHPFNAEGMASGKLIGGNISLLCHLIGTQTDYRTEGRILFIEETEEYLYRLDRMVLQLKRAGKFSAIAAMIVGHMNGMKENNIPFGKSPYEIICDHISGLNIPVCFGAPLGHMKPNYPFIVGRAAELKVAGNEVSLSFKK